MYLEHATNTIPLHDLSWPLIENNMFKEFIFLTVLSIQEKCFINIIHANVPCLYPPGKKNRKLRFSSNIEIWNTWNIARTWKSAWNGLALSWRRPQSSRNQSIDLQNKPMDWFLYDRGLHHERVKSILIKGDIDLVSTQNISYPMISTRTCVNQWVRNTSFFGTFCVWTK